MMLLFLFPKTNRNKRAAVTFPQGKRRSLIREHFENTILAWGGVEASEDLGQFGGGTRS